MKLHGYINPAWSPVMYKDSILFKNFISRNHVTFSH